MLYRQAGKTSQKRSIGSMRLPIIGDKARLIPIQKEVAREFEGQGA